MKKLAGKRALVTGAAAGIGQAIAHHLAAQQVDLWLLDIDHPRLELVADCLRELNVTVNLDRCDLARPADVTRALNRLKDQWGSIDIVVNNAGVAYYGPTEQMTEQQWDWVLSINLLAPIQIVRELLPLLLAQPESHILNVCSISGLVAGGRFAGYHTSKFGLVGYSEALRAEYVRRGIGVTALCPGPVLTDLYKSAISGRPDRPVPAPPKIVCVSVDHVARTAVKAIKKNKGLVLVGLSAHLLFNVKRFFPRLLDAMHRFSRKKRRAGNTKKPLPEVRKAA